MRPQDLRGESWREGLRRLLATAVLAAMASGCVSTEYSGERFAPTTHVDVFYDAGAVARPHTTMGTVQTKANPAMPLHSIEMELVNQAKRRGADAIVIDRVELETIGHRVDGPDGSASRYVAGGAGASEAGAGAAIQEKVVTARLLKYTS